MSDQPPRPHRPPALPPDYGPLLADLKSRVRAAQVKAALSVNREMILLYWHIGRRILDSQREHGWGARVVERLSKDLRAEFPDMAGFSTTNLRYMRVFAEAWPDEAIREQVARELPWWHNVILLKRLQEPQLREWYGRKALQYGWSRNVLELQIETRLHEREGKAITNFAQALPPPQSDLAQQVLKDPYTFDFLTIAGKVKEKVMEKGLVDHCLRHPADAPTIGLVLAREKSRLTVEYAVRDLKRPIGVAEWQTRLVNALPPELKDALPSIEEIEARLPAEAPDPGGAVDSG